MPAIIAITNQKGGVGKTTTTVNLAYYLGKQGRSVLVVDLDPQGNATSGLGLNKDNLKYTTLQALEDGGLKTESVISTEHNNVWLLPSNSQLAGAEVQLVDRAEREFVLKKVLSTASVDYIIIDCPPSLGLLTVNALAAAQFVFVPVQSEYYALEGLTQLLQVVGKVKESINSQLSLLGIVLTMYDHRTSLSGQVKEQVEKHFGDLVFKTVIPRNVRLAEAPSYGKPIAEYDKWSKGARAYKQLAKEVDKRVYR